MKNDAVLLRILILAPTEKNIIGLGSGLVPKRRQAITRTKNDKRYLSCRRCPGYFQEPLSKFNWAPGDIQGGLDRQESSDAIWCCQTEMCNYLPWFYLDIAHMGNYVQVVCEFNMSLSSYVCSWLVFALLLVPSFWTFPPVRACGSIEMK